MSTYYIADLHFGHRSAIEFSSRPYETVEEMNKAFVENWNRRVKGNDRIYILGDMFYRFEGYREILKQLNGEKHLILGNHDDSWLEEYTVNHKPESNENGEKTDTLPHKSYRLRDTKEDLCCYFKSVSKILQITDGQVGCLLCHYPLLTYKHEKRLLMIHGHLHSDTTDPFFHHLVENEKLLNAGVDINGYMPVTLEELIENNRIFKERYKRGE